MSKMKTIASMYAFAAMMGVGGGGWNEERLNDKDRYKGKGFSGGHQPLREFIISGVKFLATDKVMARKKYNKLHKK